MKKILLIFLLLLSNKLVPQIKNDKLVTCIHKYVTFQAWELVKYIHPEVGWTDMHQAMKNPVTGQYGDPMSNEYDGNRPWELGKILTGSFREDKEDPVYSYCGLFNEKITYTHFWDADFGDYGRGFKHNVEDSYEKMKTYWTSEIPGGGGHRISVGPITTTNGGVWSISVRYSNLAEFYKIPINGFIDYVRPYSPCDEYEWIELPETYPLVDYFMYECGMSEQDALIRKNKIIWEIVGRMCHLIEDMGVPAHVHDDGHPISDYYETEYLGNQQHFTDKTYIDAYNQGGFYQTDPIININNLQNPIRTITYLANQLSDRFPSDDGDADETFTSSYNTDDANFIYYQLQPIYTDLSEYPTEHFGYDPPPGLMETILNTNYVYSIRAVAGFLWYIYNQFNIQIIPASIDIYSPEKYGCSTLPASVRMTEYPFTFPCHFKLVRPYDNQQFEYSIYFRQDGVEHYVNSGTVQVNTDIYSYCTINSTNGPCLNRTAEIKIYAHPVGNVNDMSIKTYSFIPYYSTDLVCNSSLKSALAGNICYSGNTSGIFINETSCYSINSANRIKVSRTVSKNSNQKIVFDLNNTIGYDYGYRPPPPFPTIPLRFSGPWAGIENETPTSSTLYTYVYYLTQNVNQWVPCPPEKAGITYHLEEHNYAPEISGFYPSPYVVYGSTPRTFTCQLKNGTSPVTYTWGWSCQPPGAYSLSANGNQITITYNFDPVPFFPLTVWCTATNSYGTPSTVQFRPTHSSNMGCPWLFVEGEDAVLTEDNNLLHKSKLLDFTGMDITDRYVLSKSPGIRDSTITLSIGETLTDTSFINSIKLYAVDHPVGTKLCITEDNQIAIFDSASVVSVEQAYLNDIEITDDIQFHIIPRGPVDNDTLDHVSATFGKNNFTNSSIIADLKYNPNQVSYYKNYDGLLSANLNNSTFISYLTRREYKSITAIPIDNGGDYPTINSIDIDWLRGNEIRYIAIASLSYNGFNSTELPFLSAYNSSQNDDIYKVIGLDSLYSLIDFSNSLILKFRALSEPPSDSQIRDYIIEVNGRIGSYLNNLDNLKPKNKLIKKIKNASIPLKNQLNHNYPNPFNPITKIKYSIEKQGLVKMKIYDILGREIKTLVNEVRNPGEYIVEFNGSNLASGVYFYRMECNGFTDIKRMMLIK
jgi:hypothetical protein